MLTKDSDFTYLEAGTEAFSPFAVSMLKGIMVPAAGHEVTVTVPPVTPRNRQVRHGCNVLIIILIIAIAA